MYRYEVLNPLANFFLREPQATRTRTDFIRKYESVWVQCKKRLELLPGYTEDKEASDACRGEQDFIVIDHREKKWCWWANGWYPFASHAQDFPDQKTLAHWATHRS